ncbi:aldehyde dehydrogenase domain-containing protein [Baffinella frigidus]|nr:aldehyde dehydrogenase domain-containing protein [Cryptophyta sp. CCMP2293]
MEKLLDCHFINGALVPPAKGQYMDVINPADETVFGRSAAGTEEDVNLAVAAARQAYPPPALSTTGTERAVLLNKLADLVEQHKAALSAKEAADAGKPIQARAAWDVDDVAGCLRYNATMAEALDKKQVAPFRSSPLSLIDVGMEEFDTKLFYDPVGVCALITPWNYPMLMATWKVASALAAVNAIILKLSELAPFTYLEPDEAVTCVDQQAGYPPGVFNVTSPPCYGAEAGAPLSTHAGVDKVAFTGSVATGARVMQQGGKSPIVVFPDVPVDVAVEWLMFGIFWTNGQICSATSRAIIHEDMLPKILPRLKEVPAILHGTVSPELCRPDVAFIGPVISKGQYDKVLGYIAAGKAEGATLFCGGGRPADAPPKGFYIAPTVFTDVKADMKIWNEEIFGPVLAVMTFKTEEEAIALANNSDFGLAGAVLSGDATRGQRVARAFKCGIAWVNCSQPCFCQAPWGGVKRSGIGRDNGEAGFNSFLEVKQITEYKSTKPWGWYIPPGFTRPLPEPAAKL